MTNWFNSILPEAKLGKNGGMEEWRTNNIIGELLIRRKFSFQP